MDYFLANTMITNLLSNAIKHNNTEKEIRIISDKNEIIFQNTTDNQPDLKKIFNRFHKETTTDNSVGLGLSIVQKIINSSNLDLKTSVENNYFAISIKY